MSTIIDRIRSQTLEELAADAPAIVDELALERAAITTSVSRFFPALPTPLVVDRAPIRVGVVELAPSTAARAEAIAIAAVPGAPGHAVRWQRSGNAIDVRDAGGAAVKHIPPLPQVVALGDARMLVTTVLRIVQRPQPAAIVVGSERHVLVPEMTVGRTSISDVVIPDSPLSKLTWRHEWNEDAWWVRCFGHTGNVHLNGEKGWELRRLSHGDVISYGNVDVRFVAAD